ncbi:hypothetical protein EDD22DRAFT_907536 [Suillus occidentalis]|nr:hypothetical protein EDD22DRAFT_907536 [Suillus occidentalis]
MQCFGHDYVHPMEGLAASASGLPSSRPSTMDFTHPSPSNGSWKSLCDVTEYSGIFDSEYRRPHSRCMENIRVALRKSIMQVLNQRDRTNVWLNGLAGVGKTSIAFTIAEELKIAKRLAATFFFSHKHVQKTGSIIPTIAYQLAIAFPRIRQDIVAAIENDASLLSPGKSHADQMQELVIKPLQTLRFREEPYIIIIDALDECLSSEEAERLVTLLTDTFAGPVLPFIHVIFTSRPEAHIRAAMPSNVHEILLTTRDKDTIQDVRFFLRASLDKTRSVRPVVFGQPPFPWPSKDEFETLAFKAGGLFVYAAMAMNFISATGNHPQERLELLLRENSTVSADIDQLYRQIIATSEGSTCALPDVSVHHPSTPCILLPRFYHTPGLHSDSCNSNVAVVLSISIYGWAFHLYHAYPSSKLRNLLALFADKTLWHWVQTSIPGNFRLMHSVRMARMCCLSLKWIRGPSDIMVAWRLYKGYKELQQSSKIPILALRDLTIPDID